MKRLCHQRFPFLAWSFLTRTPEKTNVHCIFNEHQNMPIAGFGPPVFQGHPVRGTYRLPPGTDSSLRSRIPGVFPKGVALPTRRRPKLMRHPHPWLCGATIAVPQAARYEVVHSRITVDGQLEERLSIVASHKYTYYQDEG